LGFFAFAAREGRGFSSRWTSRNTSSRAARSVDSPEPIEGPRRGVAPLRLCV